MICIAGLWPGAALAQSPVTVTIDAEAPGAAIPDDFIGLSFEISNVLPDTNGNYLFSAQNKPLVSLFTTLGVKNLRVGGGTAEMPAYAVPGPADIDKLFAFAQATGVKVIYTFRLLNGDMTQAAALAKYMEQHYAAQIAFLSIGNEPDWRSYHNKDPKITNYPSYLSRWREFSAAIIEAAPTSKMAAPDTGSNYPVPNALDTDYNGESWTQRFASDEKNSGFLVAVLQHDYVGQGAKAVSIQTAIDAMLSKNWVVTNYPALYDNILARVQREDFNYRMTECNDYTGGVDGASNAFASALWALDYMHWHAAHRALGVNFHNKRWIFTDTIYPGPSGDFQINPKGYGLKAFDLGSHGSIKPVAIANPEGINLTAYAVGSADKLYVTLINKSHGVGAREAHVTIVSPGMARNVETIFLTAPNGDVTARTGVTLGGASITSDRPWLGKWESLASEKPGQCLVKVPAASAAIVKISTDKI